MASGGSRTEENVRVWARSCRRVCATVFSARTRSRTAGGDRRRDEETTRPRATNRFDARTIERYRHDPAIPVPPPFVHIWTSAPGARGAPGAPAASSRAPIAAIGHGSCSRVSVQVVQCGAPLLRRTSRGCWPPPIVGLFGAAFVLSSSVSATQLTEFSRKQTNVVAGSP
jgi:hypothetical protein